MPAETLHCPACGASPSSEATRCDYCGAALATVACPSCFGMMFAGAKFCFHCGVKADRNEVAGGGTQLCPRCQVGMKTVTIGTTSLLECSLCEGIWVDVDSLQQICAEREKQAAVLGMPAPTPHGGKENQGILLSRELYRDDSDSCSGFFGGLRFTITEILVPRWPIMMVVLPAAILGLGQSK